MQNSVGTFSYWSYPWRCPCSIYLLHSNFIEIRIFLSRSTVMTLSVSLSVREHISGTRCLIFTRFFYVCYLCLWLGPLLAALQYVMNFRFFGWRHISIMSRNRRRNIDSIGGIGRDLLPWRIFKLTHQGQHRAGGRVWYLRLPCSHWFHFWHAGVDTRIS